MKKLEQSLEGYSESNPYDFDNKIILNYYPNRILELVKDDKHNSLLECGIGHGYAANIFNGNFEKHLILDADSEIIEKFKKNFPECNAKIIQTFFEDFDCEETFDVIVLGFVLEHVDDPIGILKKYKKFLSTNGRLFVTVPNSMALNRRVGYLSGLLSDIEKLSENDIVQGHKRYYNIETIKKDCGQAGLKIKSMEGLFLKALTTGQLINLNLSAEIYRAFCEIGKDYPELCLAFLIEVE